MAKGGRHNKPGDWHLWEAVRQSVTPLRPEERAEKTQTRLPDESPLAPLTPKLFKPPALPPYSPPSQQAKKRDAPEPIEPRLKRRVIRGGVAIDGTLDLHGMRQGEAHEALNRFIAARAERGDRTLLIITGKGRKQRRGDPLPMVEGGILRAMLPVWLNAPALAPLIAGFSEAGGAHGGGGAFYVRIRKGAP